MSYEWRLIGKGFIVAGFGAAASMLYIVSLSAAFVGRYALAGGALAAGIVCWSAFRRMLTPYLDVLEARLGDADAPPESK